jgi:hypothetical protein
MNFPCFNNTPTIDTPVNHQEQESLLLGYLTALIQGYDKQSNIIKSIQKDPKLSSNNRSILHNCIKNINPDKK